MDSSKTDVKAARLDSSSIHISPVRAICILTAYRHHKPPTSYHPWRNLKDFSVPDDHIAVTKYNAKGFIQGQKLRPHKLTVIPDQDKSTFPQCMGTCRSWVETELYPQHGDLNGPMFARDNGVKRSGLLGHRRNELVEREWGRDLGVRAPGEERNNETIGKAPTEKSQGIKIVTVKVEVEVEVEIEAPLNEKLANAMREQLKEAEEKRKVDREGRRAKRKNTASWPGAKGPTGGIEEN